VLRRVRLITHRPRSMRPSESSCDPLLRITRWVAWRLYSRGNVVSVVIGNRSRARGGSNGASSSANEMPLLCRCANDTRSYGVHSWRHRLRLRPESRYIRLRRPGLIIWEGKMSCCRQFDWRTCCLQLFVGEGRAHLTGGGRSLPGD
jgi:hypothetical protein